jgi:hypothetical protein
MFPKYRQAFGTAFRLPGTVGSGKKQKMRTENRFCAHPERASAFAKWIQVR